MEILNYAFYPSLRLWRHGFKKFVGLAEVSAKICLSNGHGKRIMYS